MFRKKEESAPQAPELAQYSAAEYSQGLRDTQEDNLLHISCTARNLQTGEREETGIYAVSDGIGGLDSGETASRIAVKALKDFFFQDLKVIYNDPDEIQEYLEDTAVHAAYEMSKAGRQKGSRMGATLSALLFKGGRVFLMHIGDSMIFAASGGRCKKLTETHCTEDPGRPGKKILAKAISSESVGGSRIPKPEFAQFKNEPGITYVLLTDGAYMPGCESLIASLPYSEIPPALIKYAESHGNGDNKTVVAVQIGGEP